MNSENNTLRIVKAKVEQDNYEAAELSIIKADMDKIKKDLYIEKDIDDGNFYVVSDNVLVTLHRSLKEGELPNLSLISNTGDILIEGEYSSIIPIKDNIFICVKASSNMESVLNNKEAQTDPEKVETIKSESESIKNKILEEAKNVNPDSFENLEVVYEDPYNEAIVYKVDVVDSKYNARVIADEVSFVAYDGLNVYTHSNILEDIVKLSTVGNDSIVESGEDVTKNEEVETPVVDNDTFDNIELENLENNRELFEKYAPRPLEEIFDDTNDSDDEDSSSQKTIEENKVEEQETEEKEEAKEESEDAEDMEESNFDDFFNNTEKEEKTSTDEYDELGNVVSKFIEEDKAKDEKIKELEKEIEKLQESIEKKNDEIENKTKKVNTLINENRKYIDENRALNTKVDELTNNVEKLTENVESLENDKKRLEEEQEEGKMKINAVISSLDNILSTHSEDVKQYRKEMR